MLMTAGVLACPGDGFVRHNCAVLVFDHGGERGDGADAHFRRGAEDGDGGGCCGVNDLDDGCVFALVPRTSAVISANPALLEFHALPLISRIELLLVQVIEGLVMGSPYWSVTVAAKGP